MKTYNIKFNGKNCESRFYCEYQNDMYAIEDAWDALRSQPYPPTEGKTLQLARKLNHIMKVTNSILSRLL